MKNVKVQTPTGKDEKQQEKVGALAGCFVTIVGLVITGFIAWAVYILCS